jgi:hypothetical protein
MGVFLALLLLAVPIAWLALLSLVAFLGVMAVAGALSIVAKWRTWSAVCFLRSYRPFARGALDNLGVTQDLHCVKPSGPSPARNAAVQRWGSRL